ncbi:hypothetical protein ABZX92_20980 [Lentzea sp. NPDC006480]
MGRPAALARAGVLVLLSSLLQVPAAPATADQPDERSATVAARKSAGR